MRAIGLPALLSASAVFKSGSALAAPRNRLVACGTFLSRSQDDGRARKHTHVVCRICPASPCADLLAQRGDSQKARRSTGANADSRNTWSARAAPLADLSARCPLGVISRQQHSGCAGSLSARSRLGARFGDAGDQNLASAGPMPGIASHRLLVSLELVPGDNPPVELPDLCLYLPRSAPRATTHARAISGTRRSLASVRTSSSCSTPFVPPALRSRLRQMGADRLDHRGSGGG